AVRCSIRRDGRWFAIEVRDGDDLDHWYYEAFTLRARKPWSGPDDEYVVARPATQAPLVVRDMAGIVAVEAAGDLAVISRRTSAGLTLEVSHLTADRALARVALDGATTASMRLTD